MHVDCLLRVVSGTIISPSQRGRLQLCTAHLYAHNAPGPAGGAQRYDAVIDSRHRFGRLSVEVRGMRGRMIAGERALEVESGGVHQQRIKHTRLHRGIIRRAEFHLGMDNVREQREDFERTTGERDSNAVPFPRPLLLLDF